MLEKVTEDEPANVRLRFQYCLGVALENEEQVLAKMLKNAKIQAPDQLTFKGKPSNVYLHKLVLKDSIWLMWENKNKSGPLFNKYAAAQQVQKEDRKHRHRNRENETTFQAKYFMTVRNLTLVDHDSEDKNRWSFDLPKGEKVLRQLKKKDFETPGLDYRFKIQAAFKFVE